MHSNDLYRNRVGSKPSLCKTPTRESLWINVSIKKETSCLPPLPPISFYSRRKKVFTNSYQSKIRKSITAARQRIVCYTELFFYILLIQCEQRIDGGVSKNNYYYSNILSADYFIFKTNVILPGATETISKISQNKTIKMNTDKELCGQHRIMIIVSDHLVGDRNQYVRLHNK